MGWDGMMMGDLSLITNEVMEASQTTGDIGKLSVKHKICLFS